ncbi:cytochrome P450 4V2-like [Centruroides sculpturatus]|uniref:cytochrome P450 4V2-like n=1 Tax=Centruroides sculpturatus TaxID=218467 RepID=UPI000C6CC3F9|nr:cytochrome P450 4V2-like [Centruroides sculpturatus]
MSFDFFFYLTLKGREFKSTKKALRILTKEIIAEKIRLRKEEQNNIENNGNPKSLLDFLLDARDKNPEFTIESVCEEIEFFLGAETMRLYPTVPVFSRKIKKSIRLGDKEFSKDWIFVVSIYHLHRNPNVFENPNVFNPQRFLPENFSKRPPYSYIPFSAGPRMCLGNRSAII